MVSVPASTLTATTDAEGAFAFDDLPAGSYVLHVAHAGYAPADSESIAVTAGTRLAVTLVLQLASSGGTLKVVGSTTTHPGEALQQSSTISRTLNTTVDLANAGVYRAGDALRQLPGLNNGINGDTAALGDDLNLDLRGIGTLETTATLDGHPIAYGVSGGYNFQLSPIVPFRSLTVTYGSGSNLAGVSAIGGVVDFETLEPTRETQFALTQGYGTWSKLTSSLRATGTAGRLGYAAAYGVAGVDGPISNSYLYQPGAAYDPSATDPSVRGLAIYRDDAAALSRSGLLKARYALSPISGLTLTSVMSSYFEDKTGNGDGDYLGYAPALAFGNQLLGAYSPSKYPTLAACPSGTFVATNANGHPNGTGPNGAPDGGILCETPAQYATFYSGLQGAGPAYQTFNFNDDDLAFESTPGNHVLRADLYTNRYLDIVNRAAQLPFKSVPGDAGKIRDTNVAEAGATITDRIVGKNNELGFGASYLNVAYNLQTVSLTSTTVGAPIVRESGLSLEDVYHPLFSPLTIYGDITFKGATATHSYALDPRLSLVYGASPRDVLRLSTGATTTEPAANELGQPFTPSSLGGAGGGATINCAGLNSAGSVPSAALSPERGIDEELAYGHRFFADSQAQLALYNTNILNKLYSTLVPLSQTGTSFISPAYLAQVTSTIAAKCGVAAAPSLIGLTGTFNVGQMIARGFTLSGRERFTRSTFVDYDWTLDSTALVSAPVSLLQSNQTLILGSQLPRLPLHTLGTSLDQSVGAFDLRYTVHTVSANNTKSLPPYDYSDLRASIALGPGTLSIAVSNLFNQYAFIDGLQYQGVPLALNQYATAASYAPYTGTAATEQFGLPYRSIYFNYSVLTR